MSRDYMWGKKKKKRNINAEKETVETEWALTNCDDRLKLRSEMGKNELENILKHLGSWWFFREHLVLIRRDTNAKIVNATSSVAWDFLSQWCLYTNSGICSVLKQYQPTLPYTVGFPSSSKKNQNYLNTSPSSQDSLCSGGSAFSVPSGYAQRTQVLHTRKTMRAYLSPWERLRSLTLHLCANL